MENTQAVAFDVWVGGKYFAIHPEKILGYETTRSGRYGFQKAIKGTIDNVETGIDVPKPKQFPFVYIGKPAGETQFAAINGEQQPHDESKIEESIAKTNAAGSPPETTDLELISMNELIERWTPGTTQDELEVWANYQRGRLFDAVTVLNKANDWSKYIVPVSELKEKRKQWIEKDLLCYDGEEYMPAMLFYAGNIYHRINLQKEREAAIVAEIGQQGYDRQLTRLQATIPDRLKLTAPEAERLYISPVDPWIRNVSLTQFADGTILDEGSTVFSGFGQWIETLGKDEFTHGSNVFDVWQVFILGNQIRGKNITEVQRIQRKRAAQQDAVALFQRFLYEALSREDQQRIELLWNAEFNNWKEYDYSRIPIGFQINKWFKNGPTDVRPAQWDGVKFLSASGSGLIAYDVGVGKTMTAILAMGQALYTGQCKRPLVICPNPTYRNWINETVGQWDEKGVCKVHGLLPQYRNRVNDYYNLGVDYQQALTENPPQDYSITFITYEGLMQLGFSKRLQQELFEELFSILNQGELDKRDVSKLKEKIDELLGTATANTIAEVDTLGFDYVIIDEAHNMKKVFTRVKGHKEDSEGGKSKSYYQIQSGEPSGRGLKAFMLAHYIQRRHNGANTCLLTATPFTNSPLEIYSMLAMIAFNNLEKRGIKNITDFFDKFINETVEDAYTAKGRFEPRPVIKSFRNKVVLQNIIYSYITYKTGEEANVPRPKKVVMPLLKDEKGILLPVDKRVETALPATPDQVYWMKEISKFAQKQDSAIDGYLGQQYYDDKKEVKGRVLLAISLAQQLTLSPYLFSVYDDMERPQYLIYEEQPTWKDYVDNSPKIKYVVDCIRSVRAWHHSRGEEMSGQVIYMDAGVENFPLIKEYLVRELKFQHDEVELIIGGMNQEKKERIKDRFLSGKVKIIIGSSTIKEGINLQTRSTCLYNCNLDWNPTDIIQLEGRVWRQGNQHSHVRIVIPLIENSIDIFVFQKIEEKTSRINDIWFRAGRSNVLNVDELDPNELKLGLITDPEQRAQADASAEADRITNKMRFISDNIEALQTATETINEFTEAQEIIEEHFTDAIASLKADADKLAARLAADNYDTKADRTGDENKLEHIARLIGKVDNPAPEDDPVKIKYAVIKYQAREEIKNDRYAWNYTAQRKISNCDEQIKRQYEIANVQKNILTPNGLVIGDDLQPLIQQFQNQLADLTKQKEETLSDKNIKALTAKYQKQMNERQKQSRSLKERVDEFARYNYLLSCMKDVHDCTLDEPTVVECVDCKHDEVKPKEEPKPAEPKPDDTKIKRIRIAQARAKALLLLQQYKQAAA